MMVRVIGLFLKTFIIDFDAGVIPHPHLARHASFITGVVVSNAQEASKSRG